MGFGVKAVTAQSFLHCPELGSEERGICASAAHKRERASAFGHW